MLSDLFWSRPIKYVNNAREKNHCELAQDLKWICNFNDMEQKLIGFKLFENK